MQMSEPPADRGLRDLPDHREHRRVHSIGREQRSRGIEQSRPGHHRVDLRFTGGERRAERQIGRALLMAGVDGADAVAGLEQRVEQRVVVHARQRVNRIDAVGDERAHGGFGRRHAPRRIAGGWLGVLRLAHDARTSKRASVQIGGALSRPPARIMGEPTPRINEV